MIFKEDGNNDLYDKIDVSDERKQQIIDSCLKKNEQETPRIDNELDLRRNEVMKRKEYGNIINKVAVAIVSIGLSGAVIAGVVIHSNGTKNIASKNAKQETTEMTTEKNSELYKNSIFYKDEDLNYTEAPTNFETLNESRYTEMGDYIIKTVCVIPEGKTEEDVEVKIVYTDKSGGEEVEIPNAGDTFGFFQDLYFNGESLLYFTDNTLYKYNMKTQELKNVSFDSDEHTNYDIKDVFDGKIVFDSEDVFPIDEKVFEYETILCSYDMRSGNLQKEKGRKFHNTAENGYFISVKNKINGEFNKKERDVINVWEVIVERYTDTGFADVVSLGMGSAYIDNSETKEKLYFMVYEEAKNGLNDESNVTIKSFDKNTQEIKELANLRADDFGYPGKQVIVDEISDDYCVLNFFNDKGKMFGYKYTFATKEIKELGEIKIDNE